MYFDGQCIPGADGEGCANVEISSTETPGDDGETGGVTGNGF